MITPSFTTTFVLVHALAAALTAGLAVYVSRRCWENPIGKVFVATVAAFTVWTVFSMLRAFTTDPGVYVALTTVKYAGVTTTPVFFFLFGLVYADGEHYVTRRTVGALLVFPLLTLLVLATTLEHGLFYTGFETQVVDGMTMLETVRGPWFWAFAVFGWGFLGLGSFLLVYGGYRLPTLYRTHAATVVVGMLVPWIVSVGYIGYGWPHPAVDPTPLGFAAASALWTVGVFSTNLVDVSPVARSRVVSTIDNPVVVIDTDDRVTDVNEAARSLLTTPEPHGAPAAAALPAAVVERIGDGVGEGGGSADPLKLDVDGERRHFQTRRLPLGPDGQYGSVLILTDVTELTVMRQELEGRNRALERQNDRLDEFASLVSHDLRNPLTVARGNLDLLAEEVDSELLENAQRAHCRMETLIEELLELAKHGRTVGDVGTVSLDRVVETAWRNVDSPSATLAVEDDLGDVEADGSRLAAVFENLFRNAVEHGSTSPGSQARQDAVEHGSTSPRSQAHEDALEHGSTSPGSQARQDAVEHGSTSPRSQAHEDALEHGSDDVAVRVGSTDDGFYVADDGPGIPAGEREQVFEHGYTTSDAGTGFGLNIVRTVVEAHGWEIEISESDGGGARFDVRIDQDAVEASRTAPARAEE